MTRVVIVDVSHIAHNFSHIPAKLSSTTTFAGSPVTVNTTIISGVIKNVHRWSARGANPTVVCFDRPTPTRKAYIEALANHLNGSGALSGNLGVYKGNRAKSSGMIINDLNHTEALLRQGGVSTLAAKDYEADDLVMASVTAAKQAYPDLPIDIITNDTDLVPLVDEQVSVFLRSQKRTWAESKEIEKAKYIQITPETFTTFLNERGDFKNIYMPYNSLLLTKLLRGDPSDNLPGLKRDFPPKRVRSILEQCESEGYDLSQVFRYGTRENLEMMVDALQGKISEDHLQLVQFFYSAVNLNQHFKGRPSASLTQPMQPYSESALQQAVNPLRINLPR